MTSNNNNKNLTDVYLLHFNKQRNVGTSAIQVDRYASKANNEVLEISFYF